MRVNASLYLGVGQNISAGEKGFARRNYQMWSILMVFTYERTWVESHV